MFAHLNKVLVKENDKIKANDKIGLVGKTGLATGFHLHYSILKDGEYINPIHFVDLPIADYLEK